MSGDLATLVEAELAASPPPEVTRLVAILAVPERDAAWLYYGSTLRTGDLSGILDFYCLTHRPIRRGPRGLVEAVLWPEVSYHEVYLDGVIYRAKVATLSLDRFRRAAEGRTLDTTIWARFVQPAQRIWSADPASAAAAAQACVAAVVTAARFAATLGPDRGTASDYWTALFRRTYAAEFRVESAGRADTVISSALDRYAAVLPMAWRQGGVVFELSGPEFRVKRHQLPGWTLVSLAGKPLNIARLAKAAFTFEGAARYAAWKVQRHTGIEIPVTPFAERYPLLAAPGAWWRLRRRQAEARRER